MIVNEYLLSIASGATVSASYTLKSTEFLAGFSINSNVQGNVVLQDTIKDVYIDGELLQWESVTSTQFHRIDQQIFCKTVRFRTTSAQSAARTFTLRTVEL
jgi:hypothetical protein